jgi:GT2 family glycosyltransferase
MSGRPPVVVLGMMTKMPVAGVVWQTLHYLLGFERLGYDAYYVETHGRTPSMLMTREDDDGSAYAAAYIAAIMRRFGLGDRWAYLALQDEGRCFGMSERALEHLYGSAALLVNLHGGTLPRPELCATDRLVYVETDPVQLQVELASGLEATIEFLEAHCAFFTFAENSGAPDCGLPVSDRFAFHPTRQPVVTELWEPRSPPASNVFTTIGNWRQHWRDVSFGGDVYTWSKHHEFEKLLALPERLGSRFELALSSYEEDDRATLERHGWRVAHALDFSTDLRRYHSYIADSYGEFTVAKDQNVRLRTGWFSDRSATYLAAGRPVIVQDTGFSSSLPTGEGLFAFASADEVADAVARIDADPDRHRRAARELAHEYFEAETVLRAMLGRLGMGAGREAPSSAVPRGPFPFDMVLTPVSRRPTMLAEATVEQVLATPAAARPSPTGEGVPAASIVVVSYDSHVFTRLCVETVLAGSGQEFELIVVDNGSSDGSREYLLELAGRDPRVRLVLNPSNVGFPAACNQGLAVASGDALVLLNSDAMVPPGWLGRLLAPLTDDRVGLVGPATNRIGNEAEVATGYHTWGGFLREARARATARPGRTFEIGTVTMFCLAMRRAVHERLGPLDVGFGAGTLEDDDYSMRARRAGYRLVCADDVLVHHFGEASFGKLFAAGDYSPLLHRNRRRFERKWGVPWTPYARREDPDYDALVDHVRGVLAEFLPAGSTVLVVSKGDDRLLDLGPLRAWHFPRAPDGAWAGHHPSDSEDAIRRLEELADMGATHIAFPRTAFWWLGHYGELARHLDERHRALLRDDSCALFALSPTDPGDDDADGRAQELTA